MSAHMDHLLAYVSGTPWAILPSAMARMIGVLSRRAAGVRLSAEDIEAAVGIDVAAYQARRQAAASMSQGGGGIAVVPVYGTILARDWEFKEASHGGTTSAEGLGRTLSRLAADRSVSSIVLDIDSPGGSAQGMQELGDLIHGIKKSVVAQVSPMAASAAYWLASQAHEIVMDPSAEVGSIGVYTVHADKREALAQKGIAVEIIRAGEHKVAANPFEELTPEARADMQAAVDDYHAAFLAAVGRGRGVSAGKVRKDFGDGKVFRAKAALQRGMADRIGTLDDTLSRLAFGNRPKRRAASYAVAETNEEPVLHEPVEQFHEGGAVRYAHASDLAEIEIRRRRLALQAGSQA